METLINYNEDDVAELQKNFYDHTAQLDKCKKNLLYLEAYSRRENVKIFGVPQATGNENASEPEDTKEIVHNFFEQELNIENSRAKVPKGSSPGQTKFHIIKDYYCAVPAVY